MKMDTMPVCVRNREKYFLRQVCLVYTVADKTQQKSISRDDFLYNTIVTFFFHGLFDVRLKKINGFFHTYFLESSYAKILIVDSFLGCNCFFLCSFCLNPFGVSEMTFKLFTNLSETLCHEILIQMELRCRKNDCRTR